MTYRPPAESAALDQAKAFLREEAAREEVAVLVAEDQVFCEGAMFAFGAMLARITEVDSVDPLSPCVGEQNVQVLSIVHELCDAFRDLMERRHGA